MKKAETKDRIREAMKIREIKQAELVERTKIDKGQISSYLSGKYKPKQHNLNLIAQVLSVDEAWLMGFDVPMEHCHSTEPLKGGSPQILQYYNMLNDIGKHKATERVKELTEVPRYTRNDSEYVNAAHAIEGASDEEKQHDEDIIDNEDNYEGLTMEIPQERIYTIEDIYALPDGQRAELIDGRMYMMAPPRRIHQELVSQFTKVIGQYIDAHDGLCKVYPAPFAVFLSQDDRNYVEPDISVICDKNKLDEYGCNGAPDWVIEVISPSDAQRDYAIKLFKYRAAGVREYWIVNPLTRAVNVYDFEHGSGTNQYIFDDAIPVCIYGDLSICISRLLQES